MELYFLRHGEADWPDWDRPDDERPLTRRGKSEMKKVACFLDRLETGLENIVTSPLPRAEQTAKMVAKKLKINLHRNSLLEPGFGVPELKKLLKEYTGKSLMVVGHEPDFSHVVGVLTGARVKLAKAGIALVELDDEIARGRLLWLFPPRVAKGARK